MRKTQFSWRINGLIGKSCMVLCVLALLTVGFAPKVLVTPTTVHAVSSKNDDIPEFCTEIGPSSLSAAASTERIWKDRTVLRVEFLDGSDFLKEQVRNYAPLWSEYANIRFKFIESGPSDIRVSFTPNGKSWSYIGKSAKSVAADEPTMNFGWFDENTSTERFRRTILHEFGHALGLIHEHQSPGAAIKWNKKAVYKYYSENFEWNENVVNDSIFRKYAATRTQYTTYDPDSIMHYPIPAEFTTNGASVGWNTNLSKMDKAFIKKMYPKQ